MTGKSKTPIKIIGERDIELHLSNPDHHDRIAQEWKSSFFSYPT